MKRFTPRPRVPHLSVAEKNLLELSGLIAEAVYDRNYRIFGNGLWAWRILYPRDNGTGWGPGAYLGTNTDIRCVDSRVQEAL